MKSDNSDLPSSLTGAVGNALVEDRLLAEMLETKAGKGNCPQKVWGKLAPRAVNPPWITMNVVAESKYGDIDAPTGNSGTFQLITYSRSKALAEDISRRAIVVVEEAYIAGRLIWNSGRLMIFRVIPDIVSKDLPQRPIGQDSLWFTARGFCYDWFDCNQNGDRS